MFWCSALEFGYFCRNKSYVYGGPKLFIVPIFGSNEIRISKTTDMLTLIKVMYLFQENIIYPKNPKTVIYSFLFRLKLEIENSVVDSFILSKFYLLRFKINDIMSIYKVSWWQWLIFYFFPFPSPKKTLFFNSPLANHYFLFLPLRHWLVFELYPDN